LRSRKYIGNQNNATWLTIKHGLVVPYAALLLLDRMACKDSMSDAELRKEISGFFWT
jgi:hypothetical protein